MTESTYVIQNYHFGYNDECFYRCGSKIGEVFDNKEDAEKAFNELQIDYVRTANLAEVESLFNGGTKHVEQVAAFVKEKTGTDILDEEGFVQYAVRLPKSMSDEEVLQFASLAKMAAYKLIAFDDEPSFYAIWNVGNEGYAMDYDEYFTGLVYSETREDLYPYLTDLMSDEGWYKLKLNGTYDEISDQPMLLEQLVSSTKGVEYNEAKKVLKFNRPKVADLVAVNELLKSKLFELRSLSLKEIQDIEESIPQEW